MESVRLPRFDLTDPPLVTVSVGGPGELSHDDMAADTERIKAAIMTELPAEA